MNMPVIIVSLAFILLAASSATARTTTPGGDEIQQLKQQVDDLRKKVDDLDHAAKKNSISSEPIPEEDRSQIEYRESFTDLQEAVPRPYDLTIQPTYRGFIPIPHTHGMIRFNAKPRLDFINDNGNPGNNDRFVPSQIPVSGQAGKGGGYHFSMSGQGAQLSIDVRAPNTIGNPRFYYENDFAGPGNQYMNYRVRHLYGEFFNLVVGQNYTIFEDADAWPDTVDYEGPNAAISARRPILKYMIHFGSEWLFSVSLEKPDAQIDTSNDPGASSENHAPEGGLSLRWARMGSGHVQLGTIFRDIGVAGGPFGSQSTFGWGVNLSTAIDVFKRDNFQMQLTYGQGIFYFINDATENNDAAFNAAGKLKALPVVALMGGYTRVWSDHFRSAASFGFVNVENQTSQAWNAYHRTYYGSLNLIWQIYKRLRVGGEGLFGYKQVKSHASGRDFRGQVSIMYSLF